MAFWVQFGFKFKYRNSFYLKTYNRVKKLLNSKKMIFDYILFEQAPLLQIKLSLLQNFPPIQKILFRLYCEQEQQDQTLQDLYFLLNQCNRLVYQQSSKRPKRFNQLIENVFTIMTQYIINLLRAQQSEIQEVFFHLTYFKKNCGKYIDNLYSCCVLIFYVICNFKMNQIGPIQEKTQQCRIIAKLLGKQKQFQEESHIIIRLCTLLDSYALYRQKNLKKSKDVCSKIINNANMQLAQSIRTKNKASPILKIELILSSLTVSEIYKEIGKYELHVFLFNKCIQYSEKFLDDNYQLLKFLNVQSMEPKSVKVKLTRLQEKMRRVELIEQEQAKKNDQRQKKQQAIMSKKISRNQPNNLQKNLRRESSHLKLSQTGKNSSNINDEQKLFANLTNKFTLCKQKPLPKKSSTFHYATLRTNINPLTMSNFPIRNEGKLIALEQIKKKELQCQQELQNILIIKDKKKNYFRLKEQTLKYLNKQNNQLKKLIKTKSKEVDQLFKVKEKLNNQLNINILKEDIDQCKNYEGNLISEIQQNKWKYLSELAPVKKLNSYFKTFLQAKYYWHTKNVYSLVHGQTLSRSQIKLISVLRRKAHKKSKQIISQVTYNKIKHQIQYIKQTKQNNEFNYFMNIYQTQKGAGINQQIQISQQEYKMIRHQPFYNFYSLYQGKFMTFQKHILSLTLRQAYNVRKFVTIMDRFNPTKGKVRYRKYDYNFNYESAIQKTSEKNKKTVIQAVFLLKIQQIPTNSQVQLLKDQNCESSSSQSNISIRQNKQNKHFQINVQKISRNKYLNQNYNFSLIKLVKICEKNHEKQNYEVLIYQIIKQKMNQIWSYHQNSIVTIQKHFRRKLACKNYEKLKKLYHVETYIIKEIIYTLHVNLNDCQKIFFIENYQKTCPKKYKILIKNDVTFTNLQFLSKIQGKLQQKDETQTLDLLQKIYWQIQKYLKIKHFAIKIFFKNKNIRFITDFQTQFKKKLCFATIKNDFLFRGKMRQGKIMYMLTVKQFSKIPRPYSLRIFTLDSNAIVSIDAQKTIYNKEKLFLESKISTINSVIQVLSRNELQIFAKVKVQAIKKVSTRISILPNYSFQSRDSNKDYCEQKGHAGNMMGRRMSKNSMFAKFRHKALIPNQDLEAIKKMVQKKKFQKQEQSSNQQSNSYSMVSSIISARSSEDKQSQD